MAGERLWADASDLIDRTLVAADMDRAVAGSIVPWGTTAYEGHAELRTSTTRNHGRGRRWRIASSRPIL